MKAFIRATLIAVLALISFSCGSYEEEELTSFEKFSGKTWSRIDEDTYNTIFECYQFNSNGTYKYWYLKENGYDYYPIVETGKWCIIEEEGKEDKIKIMEDYGSTYINNVSTFLSGLTRNNSSSDIADYKKLTEEYYSYYYY